MYGTDERALHTTDTTWVKPPDPPELPERPLPLGIRTQLAIAFFAILGCVTLARFGFAMLGPGGLLVLAAIDLTYTTSTGRSTRLAWWFGAVNASMCALIWIAEFGGFT